MNTISEVFDGVDIIRPVGSFSWPHPTFKDFPPCCGSGTAGSVTERLVPERILGLDISPACCCHDWMWTFWPKTWQSFHYSNAVFLVNLLQINEAKGGNWIARKMRNPFILGYFAGVSGHIGARNFFDKGRAK